MTPTRMRALKWLGTGACMVGMALTSFNVYPVNLFVAGAGSGLWALAGRLLKDPPMYVVESAAVLIYLAGIIHWAVSA